MDDVIVLNIHMTIQNLKVFCELAETRSFTRTAEKNSLTQSAVSQAILALERHFNGLLAERSRKNFRLTREGQIVYEYSRELLQAYETLCARMHEARSAASGRIQLAVIHSLGLHNLPRCLHRFTQAQPSVRVQVDYRRSPDVYKEVLAGAADLGLVAYPVHNPKLEQVRLRNEQFVLICHPHHPLAKCTSVRLKALNGEKLVTLTSDLPSGRALQRLLRTERIKPADNVDLDNIDALKSAVRIDAGVAIVPQGTVTGEAATESLAAIPLEGNYSRPLAAIYRKQMALSPGMVEFIAVLKENL
jgi:DNA-binding transcriptional LysR family regulator